jgi:hypothetical protein
MTLPPEVFAALVSLALVVIGGIGTLVKVLIDRLTKELEKNTAITVQAKEAAAAAESTSNGRLSEQIKLNQELQQKLYLLQRLIDALETDPAGLHALSIARARLETLRVMRPGSREERPA